MTDDDLSEAMRSGPDPTAPDSLRARLRAELERGLADSRAAAPATDDAPGRPDGSALPDVPIHLSVVAGEEDETVVDLFADRHEPAWLSTAARMRLAWVALVLAVAGSVAAVAWLASDDDSGTSLADTQVAEPVEALQAADDACEAFVETTSFDDRTLEVLVSNGSQQWRDLGIDHTVHLGVVVDAVAELQAALLAAGFEGADAAVIDAASGDLGELASLAEAAATLAPDDALGLVSRLRDPLVAAERDLAAIGVAGCT